MQAETGKGVDWKAMMHAVRVCHEAQELLVTHHITYPRPEAELLLRVRKGEMPYPEVAALIERGLEELEIYQAQSTLPAKPDYKAAEDLVMTVYGDIVMDNQGCRF